MSDKPEDRAHTTEDSVHSKTKKNLQLKKLTVLASRSLILHLSTILSEVEIQFLTDKQLCYPENC